MPLLPFETCRKRIERAKAHSKTFAKLWSELIKEDPYDTIVSVDDDGAGGIWIEPRYEGGLPDVFSLELGEMLYQLRSALDSCVYAAAIVETGQDPPPQEKNLEFPICDCPADFKKASWKIAPLTDKRLDIIESVQPYNAPDLEPELRVFNINRTLAILNDWARKDRHRQLRVVGSWASSANPKVRLPAGVELVSIEVIGDGFLEHECKIASFQLAGWVAGMKIEANPDVFIDVAVNDVPPPCADNDTLSERTKAMTIWIDAIIKEIERSLMDERETRVSSNPWDSA